MAEPKRPRKWRGPITLLCESRWLRLVVLASLPPILYVGSFGPACRFGYFSEAPFDVAYRPCIYLALDAPSPIRTPFRWWIRQFGGEGELNLLIFKVNQLMAAAAHEKFD